MVAAMSSFQVQSSTWNVPKFAIIQWKPPSTDDPSQRMSRKLPSPSKPQRQNPKPERTGVTQYQDLTRVTEPPSMPGMDPAGITLSANARCTDIPKFASDVWHSHADCTHPGLSEVVSPTPLIETDVTESYDGASEGQHSGPACSPRNSLVQDTAQGCVDALSGSDDGATHAATRSVEADSSMANGMVISPDPLSAGSQDDDILLCTDSIEADSILRPTLASLASIGQSHGPISLSPMPSANSLKLGGVDGSVDSDGDEGDDQPPWRPSRASRRMKEKESMKMPSLSTARRNCQATEVSDNSPASPHGRDDVDTLQITTTYDDDDRPIDNSWFEPVPASLEDKEEGNGREVYLASSSLSRISPPKSPSSSSSSSSSYSVASAIRRSMQTEDAKIRRASDRLQRCRRTSELATSITNVPTKRRRGRPRTNHALELTSTHPTQGRSRPRTIISSALFTSVDSLPYVPHRTRDTGCIQSDDEQPQFDIDKISDVRTINGTRCALVHWEPTWEPLVELERTAPDAVAEYHHQRKAGKYLG